MPASIDITQNDLMRSLGDFIRNVTGLDARHVIQGLGNGVPMPNGPFVAITAINQDRLATNYHDYQPLQTHVTQSIEQTIQIDCYGEQSGEWAAMLSTLLRDDVGYRAFPDGVAPLYVDEPRMMPLETAEQNYLRRWMLSLHLQFNPATTTAT